MILLVILNLVLSVFYSNTLDVIPMNDLVIILEIPCLHSIHVLVYSTDAIIAPFFCSRIFLFHHHFSETILMFFTSRKYFYLHVCVTHMLLVKITHIIFRKGFSWFQSVFFHYHSFSSFNNCLYLWVLRKATIFYLSHHWKNTKPSKTMFHKYLHNLLELELHS